ncbi:microtubule-associated protein futsch [Anopheles darlingi]|uniref:Microtubule-associated protein futsch n=1 Tax=Anopheles darlingi TaxID=43151 RepID=W5JMB3_ANODA|nr:microtubule-associated protein futsch [Anopheles darlingi]
MGNVLCKEPNPGTTASNTGNTFSNLSSIICPNGLSKGKAHPMRKTYFTRSAVDASKKTSSGHTTSTGWQSVGLHVPDGASNKVIDTPPVAPPRKKRGATLDGRYRSDEALKVKNGFQDVFGRESRRHSCDITHGTRPASVPPRRLEDSLPAMPARQTSCFEIDASNDAFSDFSKVPTTAELERSPAAQIPRVGNRKSDRFFGEHLSDSLSPEQDAKESPEQRPKRREKSIPKDDVDKIEKFVEKLEENKPVEVSMAQKEAIQKSSNTFTSRQKDIEKDEVPAALPKTAPPDEAPASGENEEDLIKYIDRTVSGNSQLGSRAEFLMAMLEDYNDSVRYEGMQPIEEPLIVPKKRKSRHICDDHDHLHEKLHAHEKGESTKQEKPAANIILTEASIEVAPRKPSRDFSKYKPLDKEVGKIDQEFDSDEEPSSSGAATAAVVRPSRTKQAKSKQRENLPSPPAPPKFQKSLSESLFDRQVSRESTSTPVKSVVDDTPKAHTPRMLKRIISMPVTEHLNADARPETPQRPALTKSSSSSSFSTVDLQRSRICVERFSPEDYAHHGGGADELVQPKSKLITRKISWKSLETPATNRTPTPTQDTATNPCFTIGDAAVVASSGNTLQPPEVPKRKRSTTSTEMETIGERPDASTPAEPSCIPAAQHEEPADSALRKFCLGSFIESSNVLQHHDVVSVLDRVYSASDNKENIIEQFQTFLENQINAELNDPNPTNPNVAKLLEKLSRTSTASGGSDLEDVKIELVGSSSASSNNASDVDDCFDPEFEKIEKFEIVGDLPKIDIPPKHAYSGKRRDSIEYMSDWFGDSDGSTTEEKASGGVKNKPAVGAKGKRRESIEDVGSWFSNHNMLRPSFGQEFEEPSRRLRRGSDGFLGYDMNRQYPFGKVRERSESQSAEMFEDITKHQETPGDKEGTHSLERKGLSRALPIHERKVLEHRNSSDALLMKVLNREHRISHSSAHSSAEKLNNESKPQEMASKSTSDPTDEEEQKPLLSSTSEASVVAAEISNESAKQSSNKDSVEPLQAANEHSTLLKFLSKERLIE